MKMRGDALPFAMEEMQQGKTWYVPNYCANILVQVIHIYSDAITAYIIPHVSSQGSQSFTSSSQGCLHFYNAFPRKPSTPNILKKSFIKKCM